jgi:soluble lytic murein transglycosylase
MRLRIDEADPAAVRAFLDTYAGTPVADRLRVDWLKSLGRRGAWSDFTQDWRTVGGDDVELACYALQNRRRQEGDAALDAARAHWLTGQSTPDACEPLFEALFARKALTPADRRARMRLASEAGNVRLFHALAEDQPGQERITVRELKHADSDPARALNRGEFAWKTPSGKRARRATSSIASAQPGTFEACFSRPVLPAISAGAMKRKHCQKGKFHGMIASTGPIGS